MWVKVRHGYSVKLGNDAFTENTFIRVSEEEYKIHGSKLEKALKEDEDFFLANEKLMKPGERSFKEPILQKKVRTGYVYTDPITQKAFKEGEIVNLTERAFRKKHWILEDVPKEKVVEKAVEKAVEQAENRAFLDADEKTGTVVRRVTI